MDAAKSTEQKKSDAADFLDELFCDPATISKTMAKPTSGGSGNRKASDLKETPKQVSDSKQSSAVAEPSALSQPTLDSANTGPSADVKDEDTVKSKVKKEDSEKVGSTNKPRRLPAWLAGVTSDVAAGVSSTTGSSSSKAPASRKRKTPSSSSASSAAKRAKVPSPADEDKDDVTLPSPPPTKKVRQFIELVFWSIPSSVVCKIGIGRKDEDILVHLFIL